MSLRGLPGVPLCRLLAIDDLDEVEPDVPPVVAPPDQPHAALVVVAVQEQLVAIALPDFAVQGGEEPDLGGVLDQVVDACMVEFENPPFVPSEMLSGEFCNAGPITHPTCRRAPWTCSPSC